MCYFIWVLELFCSCAGTFYFWSKFEIHHFYFVCLLLFSGIGCLHEKVRGAKAPKCKSTKIDIFFVKILNYIKSCKHLQERVQLDSICTCIQFALTLRITLLSVSTHWVQILSTFVHVSTIESASANWVRVKIECNLHFFMRIANIRLNSIFCTKKNQFWCFCTLVPWHL